MNRNQTYAGANVERPVLISRLLNCALDPELLTLAESMGLKVFPRQWTDVKRQCCCPDLTVPCKHLAAVIYHCQDAFDVCNLLLELFRLFRRT